MLDILTKHQNIRKALLCGVDGIFYLKIAFDINELLFIFKRQPISYTISIVSFNYIFEIAENLLTLANDAFVEPYCMELIADRISALLTTETASLWYNSAASHNSRNEASERVGAYTLICANDLFWHIQSWVSIFSPHLHVDGKSKLNY